MKYVYIYALDAYFLTICSYILKFYVLTVNVLDIISEYIKRSKFGD